MSSESPDTRSRILEVTRELMERHQGRGIRMSDIAAKAGISRQALYLHFDNRADLLIATTRHMDLSLGVQERLEASRSATSGTDRIRAYIAAWGSYLPEIRGVARALLAMRDTDAAAAAAWDDRMAAMREGCEAAIRALDKDGALDPRWSVRTATDLLWTMLSVPAWEQLTQACGWTSEDYVTHLQDQALRTFVRR